MHPRNIYNTPPNFEELGKLYPDFAKILQLDVSGKIKIDFKSPEAVRALSRCCLLKDFNLNVELPPDKLLPTLPLRLNYLLWIEDLLQQAKITDEIVGVDIGCGATCIYCLLVARMHSNWKMFGLEIDDDNIKHANDNISRNQLNKTITVIAQESSPAIFEKLFQFDPSPKTFCICNPPFFSSNEEVITAHNRTGKRKRPRSNNSGSPSEIVYEDGGELGFVTKIVNESVKLKEKFEVFSTMLGCKKNVQKVLEQLRKHSIGFTTTEFSQGKTMRWGVAWSFKHELKTLKESPSPSSSKKATTPANVLKHEIQTTAFEETVQKIIAIFNELSISIKKTEEKADHHQWVLHATQNTWSNQRRKRRAEQQKEANPVSEKPKPNEDLNLGFEVHNSKGVIELRMFFISGSMSKDCANQILQYIKNEFKQ